VLNLSSELWLASVGIRAELVTIFAVLAGTVLILSFEAHTWLGPNFSAIAECILSRHSDLNAEVAFLRDTRRSNQSGDD